MEGEMMDLLVSALFFALFVYLARWAAQSFVFKGSAV